MSAGQGGGSARAQWWLVVGVLAGAAIAAATLVRSSTPNAGSAALARVPADAVAMVNGQPITRDTLARYTGSLARERGRLELDPAEQRRILDRVIDEELLFQYGLSLGLERSEPSARRAIVTAVIDGISSAGMSEPDRAALEAYYRENARSFVRTGPVRIELANVPVAGIPEAEAKQRATDIARRARAGESLAALAAALGRPIDPPLADVPLSIDAVRDRFGGLVVQALANLKPGDVSDPVRAMDGYWVVRLSAREPDVAPPLDEVQEAVRQAWYQREHDRAVTREVEALRARAQIEIVAKDLAANPKP